ncbi:hypothetical protein [Actinomycetospora termitidis]|uniref:Uncharacterized protein n=1 Tax=Actinomycetospora termitidis TaxID=3053470 RepID=A0ABT7MHQ0_9PSEU|nr:hypothetical protein [Actinomycetospora sp. Odt1-22]MDL5160204.1 hypothetical protein [Actinomycetospora sp. Odt1-22]
MSTQDTEVAEPDLQERLESSTGGRITISVLIVVLLGIAAIVVMPDSITKRAIVPAVGRAANVIGLDQGWALYAPTPRGLATYLEARVLDRDGTTTAVPIPITTGLSEYWDYRWQRYGDTLLNGPDNRPRWAPFARWIADQQRSAGRHPVVVTLVNISAQTQPPAAPIPRTPWVERQFFSIGVG